MNIRKSEENIDKETEGEGAVESNVDRKTECEKY